MSLVRLNTSLARGAMVYYEGDVIHLPNQEASALVRRGDAEAVAESSEVETTGAPHGDAALHRDPQAKTTVTPSGNRAGRTKPLHRSKP